MKLLLFLFLAFVLLPIVEVTLLVKLSSQWGVSTVLLLAVLTAMVGASLAKWQGQKAWAAITLSLKEGRSPAKELWDGFFILVAGIVLLTPGLISDCLGMLMLLPPTRMVFRKAAQYLTAGVKVKQASSFNFSTGSPFTDQASFSSSSEDVVIDGEATSIDDVEINMIDDINSKK